MTFKILLSTAVWGEDYLEIFLEYTLKSLYTNGNLLNKEFSKKTEYIIYAEKNYFKSIRDHSNFKKLKKKIKIKLIEINNNKKNKYLQLKNYQNFSLEYGYKNKFEYFSFIYPDSIFGENHFKTNFSKIKNGMKLVMCPGPLVIYENFFSFFKNKKINNVNLTKMVLKYLHPFYKSFHKDILNSRIKIFDNRKEDYQLYRCFDLHISIISLAIKNLKIKNSYDVDLLENKDLDQQHIGYFEKSNEGIIITLESINSDRTKETQSLLFFEGKKKRENELNIIKFCNKNFKYFHINNFIKGAFIVSNKIISKKIITKNFNLTEKYMRKILSENKIKAIKGKDTLEKFLELKRNNVDINSKFVNVLQKRFKLDYELSLNNYLFGIAPNILGNISYMKFLLIFLITIIYRYAPRFIKNLFLNLKDRNRSNIFLNRNINLIKFILMLPNSTIIKLLKKIITKDKTRGLFSNG